MTGTCSGVFGGNGLLCKPFDLGENVINKGSDIANKLVDTGGAIADNLLSFLKNPVGLIITLVIAYLILTKIIK